MKNKIVGIFICMLFLFSALPIVTGANIKNNKQESLLMKKDANHTSIGFDFMILYGKIVFNGEVVKDNLTYYNITPVSLKQIEFMWVPGNGFGDGSMKITQNPFMFPKNLLRHGYVRNDSVFLWGFNIEILP